jgi:double-stranded uracil-DNA glycosylase
VRTRTTADRAEPRRCISEPDLRGWTAHRFEPHDDAADWAAHAVMSELAPITDVLGPQIRLLLVGINPGVRSAQRNQHFAGPSNRFWPALHAAGITPELLGPDRQEELVDLGVGITNLAARPSARADELSADELREGARVLENKVRLLQPRIVAVLGLTAYRIAFKRPKARAGPQAERIGDTALWVLPNPSGLNAHAKPADHAAGLRAVAEAAGIPVDRP